VKIERSEKPRERHPRATSANAAAPPTVFATVSLGAKWGSVEVTRKQRSGHELRVTRWRHGDLDA
jgi:hypothetical protein